MTPGAYLNSSDDLNASQSNPDSVLTMCINDLEEASKYAVSGSTYGDWRDKGYLNQDGINAILADIYLWRGSINRSASDYEACVKYCDKVIQAKKEAYEQNPRHRRMTSSDRRARMRMRASLNCSSATPMPTTEVSTRCTSATTVPAVTALAI